MAWVVFITGYMGLRQSQPYWRYLGVSSDLAHDCEATNVLCPFGFSTFTFPTYAINEDMRMRGYEIWNGDAGEDVYECNGYGHGIKSNCEYYIGFQHCY